MLKKDLLEITQKQVFFLCISLQPQHTFNFYTISLSSTFPKHQKLKSQKDIKALFEEGKIVTKYPVKLLWLPLSQQDTRAGFAVAKRNFKSAVTRNKIKRLMREAYRLQKQEIQGQGKTFFTLLFLYVGKDVVSFKTIDKAVLGALKKLPHKQTAATMNSTTL